MNYYGNYQPQVGFISAPNEMYARNYPIAPGNSVMFKDENAPYIYSKTMGFSSLDRPIFEKFRLVKEEVPSVTPQNADTGASAPKTTDNTFSDLKAEVEALTKRFDRLESKVKNMLNKEEVIIDAE